MRTRKMFKSMLVAITCVSLFAFVACSDDDDEKVDTTLKISPDKIEITAQETGKAVISNGTAPYTLVETDNGVVTAKMDADTIIVTGVKEGLATVNVTDKNKLTGKITVTVKKAVEKTLSFDKENLTIEVDKEDVVTVIGGTAPYSVMEEDETIVTAEVNEDKITIKGIKAGTTSIIVSDEEDVSGTISITVK